MSRIIRLGGVTVPLKEDRGYAALIRHGKDNRGENTTWVNPPLSVVEVPRVLQLGGGLVELLFSAKTFHSSTQRRCWQTLAHMLVHTGLMRKIPEIQQLEHPTEPLLSEEGERAVALSSDPDLKYYEVLFDEHSRTAVQGRFQAFLDALRHYCQVGLGNILVVATHAIMEAGLLALLMGKDYREMSTWDCVRHENAHPLGKPSLVLLEVGEIIQPTLWNLQASESGADWNEVVETAMRSAVEIQRQLEK